LSVQRRPRDPSECRSDRCVCCSCRAGYWPVITRPQPRSGGVGYEGRQAGDGNRLGRCRCPVTRSLNSHLGRPIFNVQSSIAESGALAATNPVEASIGSPYAWRHAKIPLPKGQEASGVFVSPNLGTDRIVGLYFALTGKSKRNLINAVEASS
jgi:hypothetical protein